MHRKSLIRLESQGFWTVPGLLTAPLPGCRLDFLKIHSSCPSIPDDKIIGDLNIFNYGLKLLLNYLTFCSQKLKQLTGYVAPAWETTKKGTSH